MSCRATASRCCPASGAVHRQGIYLHRRRHARPAHRLEDSFGCTESPLHVLRASSLAESAYTLYDADLNKDYYHRANSPRADGIWPTTAEISLDRFSRYFPSFFSNPRIHGIPGGTDSFDAIAMSNVHYGFNVMDLFKFEGLYSYARARNLDESSHFSNLTAWRPTSTPPVPRAH